MRNPKLIEVNQVVNELKPKMTKPCLLLVFFRPPKGKPVIAGFFRLEVWSSLALNKSIRKWKSRIAELESMQKRGRVCEELWIDGKRYRSRLDELIPRCKESLEESQQALLKLQEQSNPQKWIIEFHDGTSSQLFLVNDGVTRAEIEPILILALVGQKYLRGRDKVCFEWNTKRR